MMAELRALASVQAVGRSAVMVVALAVLYGIAVSRLDPWWVKLVLAVPVSALVLAGVPWLLLSLA